MNNSSTSKFNSELLIKLEKDVSMPGSPWHDVKYALGKRFAARLKLEGFTPRQMGIAAKYLGKSFLVKFNIFPGDDPPTVNDAEKREVAKVTSILKSILPKAVSDANLSFPHSQEGPPELQELIELIEKKLFSMEQVVPIPRDGVYGYLLPKTSSQADRLGQSVVSLLQRDPSKVDEVRARLKNRCLPQGLRKYIYRLLLIKKKKLSYVSDARASSSFGTEHLTQQKIRENFANAIKDGFKELNIQSATKSPIANLIKRTILVTFEDSPGLKSLMDVNVLLNDINKVLNIYYVYSRKFDNVFVSWALPVVTVLTKDGQLKENDFETAMWLDMFKSLCALPVKEICNVATAAWELAISDATQYFQHDVKTHFWALGFKMLPEKVSEVVEKMVNQNKKSILKSIPTRDDLHPVINFSYWMSRLFVGSFNLHISIFIWDQLFLYDWSLQAFKLACISLLVALEDEIIVCKNVIEFNNLMLGKTVDIKLEKFIRVWTKLSAAKLFSRIP